jgi:sec-independent protein translocase protein TatA
MNLFVIAGFIGPQEIIIILVIVLLLFGGKKIPELMRGLGKGMKEFKNATSSDEGDSKEHSSKEEHSKDSTLKE